LAPLARPAHPWTSPRAPDAPPLPTPLLATAPRYVPQYKAHSSILATFQELMAAMAAVALPPQLRGGGRSTLSDLQPQARLAEWYDSCRRSHEHFAVSPREEGEPPGGAWSLGRCALWAPSQA
jgi:hypothetical protein